MDWWSRSTNAPRVGQTYACPTPSLKLSTTLVISFSQRYRIISMFEMIVGYLTMTNAIGSWRVAHSKCRSKARVTGCNACYTASSWVPFLHKLWLCLSMSSLEVFSLLHQPQRPGPLGFDA